MLSPSDSEGVYRFAYQFPVDSRIPASVAAKYAKWWMGVNYQTSAIAYNPQTNEIRIAMLIEASDSATAIREAGDQFSLLKEDLGDDAPEIPGPISEWPEWGDQLLGPLYYKRMHGVMPAGFVETEEAPPDLSAYR